MAKSTGPVLALGAITVANESVFHSQPLSWRTVIGTGILAGALALLETASAPLAVGLAYLALAATMLTRVNPAVPSPAESFVAWWTTSAVKQ